MKKLLLCFTVSLFFAATFVGFARANTLQIPSIDKTELIDSGSVPNGIAVDNLDSDSADEMVVANFQGNSFSIFDRRTDGTWAREDYPTIGTFQTGPSTVKSITSSNPTSIAIGDVTNDGRKDIVVSDEWRHRILIYPGNAAGRFDRATIAFSTGNIRETHPFSNPYKIVLGDFNSDGFLDIASANFAWVTDSDLGQSGIGSSNPLDPGREFDYRSSGITETTFNIEYKAFTEGQQASGRLEIDRRRNNEWEPAPRDTLDGRPAIWSGEGNRLPAKAVIPSGYTRVRWWSNNSCINITNVGLRSGSVVILQQAPSVTGMSFDKYDAVGYFSNGSPYSIAKGDFNFDAHGDELAVANENSNTVSIFRINSVGNLQHAVEQEYNVGVNPVAMVAAELSGDSRDDLVTSNWKGDSNFKTGSISLLLQNNLARFDDQINYGSGVRPLGIAADDLNGDGKADVVVANGNSDSISVFSQKKYSASNYLDPLNSQLLFNAPYRSVNCIATGDLNGDGFKDVVVGSSTGNKLMIFNQTLPDHPSITVSSSSSHPTLENANVSFTLEAPDDLNGIEGYYWVIDTSPYTVPTSTSNYTIAPTAAITVSQPTASTTPVTVSSSTSQPTGSSTPTSSENPAISTTKLIGGSGVETLPTTITKKLSDGNWWFHAVSKDGDGHIGTVAEKVLVGVDATPPSTPLLTSQALYSSSRNAAFSWSSSSDSVSGLKGYIYRLDDATSAFMLPSITSKSFILSEGVHNFYVSAVDMAGNSSPWLSQTVVVDFSKPSLKVLSPSPLGKLSGWSLLKAVSSDESSACRMKIYVDRVLKKISWSSPFAFYLNTKNLSEGTHTLEVVATDVAGNSARVSRNFFVDNYKPVISNIAAMHSGEKIVIRYKLHESFITQVRVGMRIVDGTGRIVMSRSDGLKWASYEGTKATTIWNCRDYRGKLVSPGTYRVLIGAVDGAGNMQKRIQRVMVRVSEG